MDRGELASPESLSMFAPAPKLSACSPAPEMSCAQHVSEVKMKVLTWDIYNDRGDCKN